MRENSAGTVAYQAGALTFARLLTVVSEALMTIFVVRLIGKAEVGALTSLLLVYQTAVLIARIGLPATTTFYLTGRSGPERRAIAARIATMLGALGILAGLFLAAGAGLAHLQRDLFGNTAHLQYLIVLSPLPVLELPTLMLPNLLVLEGRAQAAAATNTLRSLGASMAMLVPIAAGQELWVVGACMVLFAGLYFCVFLALLRALYRQEALIPAPVSYRELLRFAIPLGMTDIIGIVNNRVDRYLILGAYSAARFAEYQVGAFQVPFIINVPYDVGTALAPRLRKLFQDGRNEQAIDEWRQSIHKVSLLVVPVTMAFLVGAEEFIGTLFPAEYAASASVFRCYTILSLGRVAAFGPVITAAGAPRFVFYASLFAMASNLLLSIPLLLTMGFLGPALGTALAFVPMVAAYCHFIARAAGLPFSRVFPLWRYAQILSLALIAALPAVTIKLWFDGPPLVSFTAQAVALLAGFAALGTLSGHIADEDWRFVVQWLKLRPVRS